VGLIACQWAKLLGVKLIGTVGSDEKAALARAHGAWATINYNKENFVERVRDLTGGAKVPVVYDGVGKDTWEGSLDCLQPRGLMVSFGNASGPVPPMPLTALKGTLYITRPSLMPHTESRANLLEIAGDLMKMVSSGKVKIEIDQRYKLADAVQAHRDLEGRKTTGSTVLLPRP
jgi:NADPH2:quinone reductase